MEITKRKPIAKLASSEIPLREAQRQRELEAAHRLAETEKARAEEQASSVKRLRRGRVFLAGALAVAIIAGIFASNARQQALVACVRELWYCQFGEKTSTDPQN